MTHKTNTIFSYQTTLKKAKFLEFGLKNTNLATLEQKPYDRGRALTNATPKIPRTVPKDP